MTIEILTILTAIVSIGGSAAAIILDYSIRKEARKILRQHHKRAH